MKALSPLVVFLVLYLATSLIAQDFYKVPIAVAFLVSSFYALLTVKGTMNERINIFAKGAGNPTMVLMLAIFILAGAFAASAKTMGAVDATVNLALAYLPEQVILRNLQLLFQMAADIISLQWQTVLPAVLLNLPNQE